MVHFIDLFCGVGGFRLGLDSQPNFHCVFSCDINEECRKTYYTNFNDMPKSDITKIDISKDIPSHDILCAGFPCQPFSICGLQHGFEDTRGTLFFEICKIIKEKNPSVVLLENVKNLIHHNHGQTFNIIVNSLEDLGYNVSWKILNAVDFGVPQNRERIIIIASKNKKFNFDKIKFLNRKNLIDILDVYGSFEFLDESEYTVLDNPVQQKKSGLIFAGYRNKPLRITGVRSDTEHLSRVHKQPNRIYSVYGTHPTIPSQEPSGRFFILLKDNKTVRKLTLNECWKLMGFPENFKKNSSKTEQYK